MKRKLLLILTGLILSAGTAMAQPSLEKGSMLIQGDLSNSTLRLTPSPIAFVVNGSFGYFVADDLALMGRLRLGVYGKSGSVDSSADFGLDVGVRYYFTSGEKGALFANGLIGFNKYGKGDANFAFKLDGGYSVFITDHFSFEPMLQIWVPFSSGSKVWAGLAAGFTGYF